MGFDRQKYMKEYNLKHKERLSQQKKDLLAKAKDKHSYYMVYYLPNEHYVGVTQGYRFKNRIAQHVKSGKDIEGFRVMFCSKDKSEAYHHEALYHSVLGIKGLHMK